MLKVNVFPSEFDDLCLFGARSGPSWGVFAASWIVVEPPRGRLRDLRQWDRPEQFGPAVAPQKGDLVHARPGIILARASTGHVGEMTEAARGLTSTKAIW
eukprot:1101457-Pyramimonas_sp.AAC.1